MLILEEDVYMHMLKTLSETIGVSGYENSISKKIDSILSMNTDIHIEKDRIGNLICHLNGTAISPKVMIVTHMDEVGFQVMDINEFGNAKLKTLGNIKTWNALNQRLSTSEGEKKGIITCDDAEGIKQYEYDKLQLIPTKGKLRIGDVFGFDSQFMETTTQYIGKAMDNRISCYLLCKLLEKNLIIRNSIDFVFTVQEEIGMRGSRVAIAELTPDIIIDIDTSPVGERNSLKMGCGVGIKLSDSIGVSSLSLVNRLEKIAENKNISYQREVSDCGTSELIITNEKDVGAQRVGISIPCQNMHTAMTIVNKADVEACTLLVSSILELGL